MTELEEKKSPLLFTDEYANELLAVLYYISAGIFFQIEWDIFAVINLIMGGIISFKAFKIVFDRSLKEVKKAKANAKAAEDAFVKKMNQK